MKKEYKILLKIMNDLLQEGKEPDIAMLAKKSKCFTSEQVYHFITEMEEKNLVEAFEIDMCCGEDYIIKALTKKGEEVLYKTENHIKQD